MKNIKGIFTILLGLMFLLSSCNQDPIYESQGSILGADYSLCACCGGWFIDIAGDTLRFQTLPSGTSLGLDTAQLPMDVELNWEPDSNRCLGDEIIVTEIRRL